MRDSSAPKPVMAYQKVFVFLNYKSAIFSMHAMNLP